ncbi:MAG: hypothetical protein AMXMBFR64_43850 [Myxococcales bacterium]
MIGATFSLDRCAMRSAVLVLCVLLPHVASALERVITVQGAVLTSAGAPSAGDHSVVLRLFAAQSGGSPVYEQSFGTVSLAGGVFDLALGPLPSGVAVDESALWLEAVVDGQALPRGPLRPVPFTLVAERATVAGDVTCAGCVSAAEVGFPYAHASSKGGAATGLDCTGCVTAGVLGAGAVGTAHLQDGAVTAGKVGFPWAAAASAGGLALGVSCTGCIGPGHLAANLALQGDVTVGGTLAACTAGAPGCTLKVGAQAVTPSADGWMHLQATSGVRVRSADGSAYRPLAFGGGQSWGSLTIDGDAGVSGALSVGTLALDPDATLLVAGAVATGGLVSPPGAPLTLTQRGSAADVLVASEAAGELVRVKGSSGRVGIGTASPQATLDVAGGVRVGADAGACTPDRPGTLRWSSGLEVCDGQAWRPVHQPAQTGASKGDAARSCRVLKDSLPGKPSGMYWLDPDGGSTDNAFFGYCDMTTDGGGWLLVSTQKPDGNFWSVAATASVVLDKTVSQKYAPSVLSAFASMGAYRVMVEENSGVDVTNGAVMVYRMPQGVALRFDGQNVAINTLEWWTGTGFAPVSNNAGGNWWGISVHGDAFGGLASNKRCVLKSNHATGVGTNGDYKLDHQGTHAGTTRCFHGNVGIGVAHWVREEATGGPAVPDGTSVANAGQTCKSIKADGYSTGTGYYWLDPDGGSTSNAFFGYCDMTTDGGGWLLVSTQKPDGNLASSGPVASVTYNTGANQKYAQSVLNALAALGQYQVMVEENQGLDVNSGLVMVYRMPQSVALRFDGGNVALSQVQWFIGGSSYYTVTNNAGGNWWGISVHGDAFNGLPTGSRCVSKATFQAGGGNNGDYKLDHLGTHSGTTRCTHGTVGIGVTHWVR